MQRWLVWSSILLLVVAALVAGTLLGLYWSDTGEAFRVTVDGEPVDRALVALGSGAVGAFVAVIALFALFAVFAAIAIVVPLVIAVALVVATIAVVCGLSPLLVPIGLVVVACVLLSRRAQRQRNTTIPSTGG